jgi:hypothetical protein
MIDALVNIAVFVGLVLCIIGFGMYGTGKERLERPQRR